MIFAAGRLPRRTRQRAPWAFSSLVGVLAELSEETPAGATSVAASLIVEAQKAGEPVAWVAGRSSIFYPPDLADCGIDLDGVTVVWAPGAVRALLAADHLLRSGAFGFAVVDLGTDWRIGDTPLARLSRLADRHSAAVLFLTVKGREEHSIGSMIALRGVVETETCSSRLIHTVRDKHGVTGATTRRAFDAPPGMR